VQRKTSILKRFSMYLKKENLIFLYLIINTVFLVGLHRVISAEIILIALALSIHFSFFTLRNSKLLYIYFLLVSALIVGVLNHNSLLSMLKDAYVLALIMIPFIIYSSKKIDATFLKNLVLIKVFCGLYSSAVLYLFIGKFGIFPIFSGFETFLFGFSTHRIASLFYEPTISYTSVFLTLFGIYKLKDSKFSILLILLGFILYLPGFLVSLRVQSILYWVILIFYLFKFKTKKLNLLIYLSAISLVAILTLVYNEQTIHYLSQFSTKLISLGTSQKTTELISVMDSMNSTQSVIGKGLGGDYYNTVYKGNRQFSHSFFSYLYLKTGLVGLISTLVITLVAGYKRAIAFISGLSEEQFIILSPTLIIIINGLIFQTVYSYHTCYLTLTIVVLIFQKFSGQEISLTLFKIK
jgi:hypothetical protein